MTITEKLNEIEGTNFTPDELESYMYENRILPCMLDSSIEGIEFPIEAGYPVQNGFLSVARGICKGVQNNCRDCLEKYVRAEYKEIDGDYHIEIKKT